MSFDLPLIRTLRKAYYWQKLLDSGEVPTIAALAGRLNLHQGWVAEVLRMTRLAPDIVQAILNGTQPRHLNLHALRGRQALVPLDCEDQGLRCCWAAAIIDVKNPRGLINYCPEGRGR